MRTSENAPGLHPADQAISCGVPKKQEIGPHPFIAEE